MTVVNRIALGIVVVAVTATGTVYGVRAQQARGHEAEFQEQLRRAREEGIPTTAGELVATLPKVKLEENAGPIYASIPYKESRNLRGAAEVAPYLIWSPNENLKEQARTILSKSASVMEKAGAAVKLPQCVFERDYSLGSALLMPELMILKDITRTFTLRGGIAAAEGDHASALADAKNALTVARHLHNEPMLIGYLVSNSCESIALNYLCNLSMKYREVPSYRAALSEAIAQLSVPLAKSIHRFDFLEIMTTIEFSKTKEGRAKIGLSEGDEPAAGVQVLSKVQSPEEGIVKVVKSLRAKWAALDTPWAGRNAKLNRAETQLFEGLVSFPDAAMLIDGLGNGRAYDPERAIARHLGYKAIQRALENPTPPAKMDTKDLRSPFDNKPVSYKFENGRIVVEVSLGDFYEDRDPIKISIGPPLKPYEPTKP